MEHGTPAIKADIEGVERSLIMDTRSDVSILKPGISNANIRDTNLRPYGVTGKNLEVKGRQTVSLGLGGRKFNHTCLVCTLPTEAAGLLGTHFLERRSAHINFKDKLSECRVLTVFTPGKEGHSPQPMWQTEERKDERVLESPLHRAERGSQRRSKTLYWHPVANR